MIHFQGEITSQHDAGRFQATSPLLNSSLIQNEGACKPAAQSRLFFISSSPSVWLLLEIVISSCMLYLCVPAVSPCHYWKTNTRSKICINLRKVTENVCGLCWLVLKQDKSSVGGKSCVWRSFPLLRLQTTQSPMTFLAAELALMIQYFRRKLDNMWFLPACPSSRCIWCIINVDLCIHGDLWTKWLDVWLLLALSRPPTLWTSPSIHHQVCTADSFWEHL